jgi:exopolysaccharide production protein ExoQ
MFIRYKNFVPLLTIVYITLYNSYILDNFLKPIIGIILLVLLTIQFLANKDRIALSIQELLLLILHIYILFSYTWSIYDTIVLKDGLLFLILFLMSILITRIITIIHFTRLLIMGYLIISFFSFISIILYPYLAIDQFGDWQGLFHHKNILGINMSLFSILLIYKILFINKKMKNKIYEIVLLIIAISLLFKSNSGTALIVFIVINLIILLIILKNKINNLGYLKISIILFCSIIISSLAVFVIKNLNNIFQLLGKDSTLTGRDYIWEIAIEGIKNKLFFGHGIRSFWYNYNLEQNSFLLPWGQVIWHSHNGLLELIIQFGLIGASIFLVSYTMNFFAIKQKIKTKKAIYIRLTSIYLFFILISNITESYLLGLEINFWFFYLCFSCYLFRK